MKDAADPAGIIRSIKSLKKAGINIDTIMAAARKLAEPDLIRLGRLTKKGIPSGLVESLIKHGDDFAKYSDEFLLLIKDTSKSYDDILKYASKYGDDFVEAYKKYGDKAVDAFSEHGDDALDWLKKNYGDGGSGSKIIPTGEKGGIPKGQYETPDINDQRPIIRQNETADLLALQGYDIEMLPYKKQGNGYGITAGSNPDFIIEGKIFDCYSPTTNSARNIRSTINKKVNSQCNNIILNLDDCPINIEIILQAIEDEPINNLEVLMYVKNSKVYQVLP